MRRLPLLVGSFLVVVLGYGCDASGALAPDLGASPQPSCPPLTRDLALEQVFPTQIDAQPVVNVQSAPFLSTICLEGGQQGIDAVSSAAPAGTDLSRIVIGSAETVVDDQALRIPAYRVPGSTENDLLSAVADMAQAVGGDPAKFSVDNPSSQVGGKTVRTWTDAEGRVSYLYVVGDALVVLDNVTPSQADRILATFS